MVRVVSIDGAEYDIPVDLENGVAALRRDVSAASGVGDSSFDLLDTSGAPLAGVEYLLCGDAVVIMRPVADEAEEQEVIRPKALTPPLTAGPQADPQKPGFLKVDINITPDVDLLLHAGDDYDLVTAIAELVDNSIQSTEGQTERRVHVSFVRPSPSSRPERVVIFDNGKGMTLDGVKRWATLGRTTPPGGAGGGAAPSGDGLETPKKDANPPRGKAAARCLDVAGGEESGCPFTFRCATPVQAYLNSDFSRYGVGSKKAVFSIGSAVTVSSRAKGSPWVTECTLSRRDMRAKGWTTELTARRPTAEEARHASFTCFTITELAASAVEGYSKSYLINSLAHIYHYYLWGPQGNYKPPPDGRRKEGDDSAKDEQVLGSNASSPASAKPAGFSPVQFRVDGDLVVSVARHDTESLLLRKGVNRVSFDFVLGSEKARSFVNTPISLMRPAPQRVENHVFTQTGQTQLSLAARKAREQASQELFVPSCTAANLYSGVNTTTQDDRANGGSGEDPAVDPDNAAVPRVAEPTPDDMPSTVKVVLFYFPFRDGLETMPIPAGISETYVDDEKLPLYDRKPGLEVFWNGRLLPREFIESWPLLKATAQQRREEDIPAACFRRVKGMVFVDAAFAVTANKHSLCRDSAWTKALLQYTSRSVHQNIRRWVKDSHKIYDEELIFGELDKSKMKGDGQLFYKSVKVATLHVTKGTWVHTKPPSGRGKVIGTVLAIFTNPKVSEASHGCQIVVSVGYTNAALGPNAAGGSSTTSLTVPVGLIQRLLEKDEAEAEIKRARKSLPAKLTLSNCPAVLTVKRPGGDAPGKGGRKAGDAGTVKGLRPFTLTLCTEEGKPVAKSSAVDVTVTATPAPGSRRTEPFVLQHHVKSARLSKAAEYEITFAELAHADADFLTFSGRYKFQFRSTLPSVAHLEYAFDVTGDPLDVAGFSLLPTGLISREKDGSAPPPADDAGAEHPPSLVIPEVRLGVNLPAVDAKIVDSLGNAVPFSLFQSCKEAVAANLIATVEARLNAGDDSGLTLDTGKMKVQDTPAGLRVTGLECQGTIPPDAPQPPKPEQAARFSLVLTVEHAGRRLSIQDACEPSQGKSADATATTRSLAGNAVVARFLPGKVSALVARQVPQFVGWKEPFKMTLHLHDAWRNVVTSPPSEATMRCGLKVVGKGVKLLKADTNAELSTSGVFPFEGVVFVRPAKEPMPSDDVKAAVKATVSYVVKGKEKATSLALDLEFTIRPPQAFPHLVLAGTGVSHTSPMDTVISAVVGDEFHDLIAVFKNPPAWWKAAVVVCSWATEGSVVAFEENAAPSGNLPESPGTAQSPATPEKRVFARLPVVPAPTKESRVALELRAHKAGDETEKVEHHLTITYQKGKPAALMVVDAPEKVQLGEFFNVQCRVTDRFGNEISTKDPALARLSLRLSVAGGGGVSLTDAGEQAATKKKDSALALMQLQLGGASGPCALKVEAWRAGEPPAADAVVVLSSDDFTVNLLPGLPRAVTIDGKQRTKEDPFVVVAENMGSIEPLRIGLSDEWGNACDPGKRRIVVDCPGDVKLVRAQGVGAELQKTDGRLGIFTPSMAAVAKPGCKPANPLAEFSMENLPKAGKHAVARGHVRLDILPGKLPWALRIEQPAVCELGRADDNDAEDAVADKKPANGKRGKPDSGARNDVPKKKVRKLQTADSPFFTVNAADASELADKATALVAGTPLGHPVKLSVLCENDEPSRSVPTDRISLHITSQAMPSCLSFPGPVEPSQSKTKADTDGLPAVVVAFDDLQKYAPTAAGLYAVHGEIDLNYHVYRDHLEKMKLLTLRRSLFYFAVSPDKPFALRGKVVREAPRKRKKGVNAWSAEDARGSAWGASHHLGGVASGKQLFEKLLVRVEDAHGNVCDGVGGTVSAKIMGFTEKTGPTTVKTAPSLAAAEGEAATFELKQGCVEIPALSLGTNASHAPEGNYCLVISFPQGTAGSVTSVTLPFHYTDDNAKETLLQELAARKRDWVAYQQYLEKKLARHEGEKQKYYAVEAKWDARMREIQQEMLNTKRLKSPNWETFVAKDLSTQTGDALRKMEREAGAAEKAGKDAKGRRKYYFQDMHDGLKMVNDAKMQEGSGIIGVLAELGFVGDEQLDACLSKTLGRYMQTVLLEGETTLVDWKKRLRNLPPSQNLALLATDNVSRVQLDAEGKILHLQTPKPRPAGWVGYAANLVELADSNKYLRSVFFSLLGSKAVFDTIESARAWRREMLRHNGKPPPLICLDGEKMEQTGIEWAGQQLRDPGFRFGAMPVRLTEKYKAIKHLHNLLETYDELLAEKAAELAARPPLDPHNVQPRCHAKVQEVATKIKAMSKVLDQPLETVSTASLQGHLSDAVPEQSQVVSAQRDEAADGDQEKPCVKRKVPGGPKSAFDFDGESDSDEVPAITIKRPRGARAKKAN